MNNGIWNSVMKHLIYFHRVAVTAVGAAPTAVTRLPLMFSVWVYLVSGCTLQLRLSLLYCLPFSAAAPKICEVTLNSCLVEWAACKPMGQDTIVYVLQLQSRNQEYTQVHIQLPHISSRVCVVSMPHLVNSLDVASALQCTQYCKNV